MNPFQRPVAALCLAALTLVSCSQDPDPALQGVEAAEGAPNAEFGLVPPAQLLESRNIPVADLDLSISVTRDEVTETVVVTRSPSNGTWSGVAFIPTGTTVEITLKWVEDFRGADLELAEATRIISVPFNIEELEVVFPSNIYNTTFDEDGDGYSNLAERNTDTDPRSNLDPGEAVVLVNVGVRLETPGPLASTLGDPAAPVATPTATVNGDNVALTFDDTGWVGTTTAVENSDAFLSARFVGDTYPGLDLVTVDRSQNVGGGTTIVVTANDYVVAIDNDNDGFDNVDEFVDGTDPTDPLSPVVNPCDLSQFNEGCDEDSDDDGKPDSVEGGSADTDQDTIPDYLESSIADADGDLIVDELDIDNNDPCIPETSGAVCQDIIRDTDSRQ